MVRPSYAQRSGYRISKKGKGSLAGLRGTFTTKKGLWRLSMKEKYHMRKLPIK
jgi:hypothetical protein